MVKTITFAAMHFSVAFAVAYILTGDVVIGGAVALVEPAVNSVAYYFHEKVWALWASSVSRASGRWRHDPAGRLPYDGPADALQHCEHEAARQLPGPG